MSELPPFLIFFAAALAAAFTRGLPRQLILLATPVTTGLYLWLGVNPGTEVVYSVMNYELSILRTDKLSLLFGYLFCIAGFFGVIFALHVKDTKQHIAGMIYLTDLDGSFPDEPADYPVLWAAYNTTGSAPFGRTIHVKK